MQKIYVVDAFITSKPFSGNSAGVCILEERQSDNWMQAIASEMNHSETAFVLKNDAGFSIRYFTPTMEIPLCGHATLASARVLWEEGIVSRYNEITFISNGGTLQIKHQNDQIVMSFPKLEPNIIEDTNKISLKELRLDPVKVAQHQEDILFELETDKDVINYTPNFETLKKQPYRMIILTTRHSTHDIVSRVFAPNAGINEDPATGIAHCILGPYWSKKLNKSQLEYYQSSKRGANISVEVLEKNVYLLGKTRIFLSGKVFS